MCTDCRVIVFNGWHMKNLSWKGSTEKKKAVLGWNWTLDYGLTVLSRVNNQLLVLCTDTLAICLWYVAFPLHQCLQCSVVNESTQQFVTINLELPDDECLMPLKSHINAYFGCRVSGIMRKEYRQTGRQLYRYLLNPLWSKILSHIDYDPITIYKKFKELKAAVFEILRIKVFNEML